jgi:hypothetical protein
MDGNRRNQGAIVESGWRQRQLLSIFWDALKLGKGKKGTYCAKEMVARKKVPGGCITVIYDGWIAPHQF